MEDLSGGEVSDLFTTVQAAETLTEIHFKSSSSTISIQDGQDAGQTIQHLHVHILPRKPGDFKENDQVYEELEKHDKGDDIKWRSFEEMKEEADQMRMTFKDINSIIT